MLREARRWIASTLLPGGLKDERTRPVAAWKAWLFAAWVVVVVGLYCASMLGWIG